MQFYKEQTPKCDISASQHMENININLYLQ